MSHTPGLEFFRYRSSAQGKSWEPIFGTANSTSVFEWTLLMFHPAVCAAPTNGTATATFEAFAVDSASGLPLTTIAPGSFTLNWTIVPSARPVLELGPDLALRWPASATNYVLVSAEGCGGPWTAHPGTPLTVGTNKVLTINPTGTSRFFRLLRDP